MIKQKGIKAIIISLLIVLSTTCFSLLFTNAYKTFTKEQPQAAFNLTISSVDEWNTFAINVANGDSYAGQTVGLNADLDFSGKTFIPVGAIIEGTTYNGSSIFSGSFDGQGHIISNISLNITSNASSSISSDIYDSFDGCCVYLGLFAKVGVDVENYLSGSDYEKAYTRESVIQNICVKDMSISTGEIMPLACGAIAGGTFTYKDEANYTKYKYHSVTIQKCAIEGYRVAQSNSDKIYYSYVGGLVGYSESRDASGRGTYGYESLTIEHCMVNNVTLLNCPNVAIISPALAGLVYS